MAQPEPAVEWHDIPPATYPNDDVQSSGARGWVVGCFFVIVLMVAVPACVGVSAYIWRVVSQESAPSDDRDRDDGRNDSRLVKDLIKDLEDARVDPLHCVYFAKVCKAIANRLEVDNDSDQPVFTQRSESVDLIAVTGKLAVSGVEGMDYRDLPDVIESAFDGVWESGDDGKLMGGPLTEGDRDELVERWQQLGEAFAEVAS